MISIDILVMVLDLIDMNFLHRNVIIFGVDMSSSTQGLEHRLSAEKMYSINFAENNKKFCLSLHYNGANSYLFGTGTEINLKQKILKLQQIHYV